MSLEPSLETFDLIVIGGGIVGAGVARDAALRGLSCLLVEKGDFSSGTSSRTSRLVHGGLSYLERGEFRLSLENLHERETLVRMAPHLARPIPVLMPVYRGDARRLWKVRAGLRLYDFVSLGVGSPNYEVLHPSETLRRAPFLKAQRLKGAGFFFEYQMPFPERLVLENIFSAREHGGFCLNYHEVTAVRDAEDGLRVEVRDSLAGCVHQLLARVVVNAAGVWTDRVSSLYAPGLAPKVAPSRGTHVVVDRQIDHAVFLPSRDGRTLFLLPFEGLTLVGCTNGPWVADGDELDPNEDEVARLLADLRLFASEPGTARVTPLWAYAGSHPLAARGSAGKPAAHSHRYRVHREGVGGHFLTVVGGSLTTFRKMAEEAVDAACGLLKHPVPCSTDRVPFLGGGFKDRVLFRESMFECTKRMPNLPREVVDHLVGLYGRRCYEVIALGNERAEWREVIAPAYRDYRAQVVYAIRSEDAHHLDDVILRRLRMGLSSDRGLSAVDEVSRLMAEELGWDDSTRRLEVEAFRERAERERPFGRPSRG